jgi:hypothetical protein
VTANMVSYKTTYFKDNSDEASIGYTSDPFVLQEMHGVKLFKSQGSKTWRHEEFEEGKTPKAVEAFDLDGGKQKLFK